MWCVCELPSWCVRKKISRYMQGGGGVGGGWGGGGVDYAATL